VLPVDGTAKEAKCEDLEKIVVGDDLEIFFRSELCCLLRRRKS